MAVLVPGTDWNHAAMRDLTRHMLELDRSVVDMKADLQLLPDLPQNRFTL